MLEFEIKGKIHTIPDKWEELSQKQYLLLLSILYRYINGKITSFDTKREYIIACLDIDTTNHNQHKELLDENLRRLAGEIVFFFSIEYSTPLNSISKELREKLNKISPNEFPDSPEILFARRQERRYVIDFLFCNQMIPSIKDGEFQGYKLSLHSRIISTSLTAQQFIAANDLYRLYLKEQSDHYLDLLIGTLYTNPYSSEEALRTAQSITEIPLELKTAIVFTFKALVEFINKKTKWSVLWESNSKENVSSKGKISLGMMGSLYSLVKAGYGRVEDLSQMPLLQFFDLLLKSVIDAIQFHKDMGCSVDDISDKMGLSTNTINRLI